MLFTSGTGNDFRISRGMGLSCSAFAASKMAAAFARPSGPSDSIWAAIRAFSSFSSFPARLAEGLPITTIEAVSI